MLVDFGGHFSVFNRFENKNCLFTKTQKRREKDLIEQISNLKYHSLTCRLAYKKDDFESLREIWDSLLTNSKNNNMCFTWEFNNAALQTLPHLDDLKLLIAYDNNEVVGIAPFKKSKMTSYGLSFKILEPLTYRIWDSSGLVLKSGFEKSCFTAFLSYFYNQKDWDFIYFYDIPEQESFQPEIDNLRFPFETEKGSVYPFLNVSKTWDSLKLQFNKSFRKNIKRSSRLLEQQYGKVELKKFDELFTLDEAMKEFMRLHQQRWLSKNGYGNFSEPNVCRLFLTFAKHLEEKGWLRLYFLTVNGEPVSTSLNVEYYKKMSVIQGGFNPAFARFGVGNLIHWKILQECTRNDIDEYDFGKGNWDKGDYKWQWCKEYRQNKNLTFTNHKVFSHITRLGIKNLRKCNHKRFEE